ncbi:hypothetical protein PH547_27835 [Rhizobium sp. CNPSo 3464]|uniref:hypothetical protein n=1 Tax=Rhizobium sp. CNPSo 3464 TaxID=3021406 RepID=UPI00254AED88|nr:hypothetical protein [Rhizobium sp. CNPSo 3464]MDK4742705.1 hypothetical protein [Rhizobium sp. CNPSo 3464]
MSKFFIVSAIALASLAATSLPSQAASVVVTTDGGGPYYHHSRHYYQDRDDWHYRHHRHHCFTRVVKEWHHGHRVVTEERICR